MNNDLNTIDFTRTLPPPLRNDPDMLALARVIAAQLQITAGQIGNSVLYARMDQLDEETLDILAYDLHVDWYDYAYPLAVKRRTIQDSVRVHRQLGTKYAVETALGAVFPGSRVEEWFEYGGEPYRFRVVIGVTDTGVSAQRQQAVLERVRFYQNLRSHLEAVSYRMEKAAAVEVAAYPRLGQRLAVYPYLEEKLVARGNVAAGGCAQWTSRLAIHPYLTPELASRGGVFAGGCLQWTGRLAVVPGKRERQEEVKADGGA